MGFKRAPKNRKGHRWINYPNYVTRKCTKCGVIVRQKTIQGKNYLIYYKDGIELSECPECVSYDSSYQ